MPNQDPLTKFTFDSSSASLSAKNLELAINAKQARIEKICSHFTVKGVPILDSLIRYIEDEEEMKKVGEALVRLSVLIPQLRELQKQKAVVDFAIDHPNWLAAQFGNFDDHLSDEHLASLLKEDQ